MTDTGIKALIERLRQRSHSNRMLLTDPPKPAPDADCHAAADMLVLHLATKQELSDYKQQVSDAVAEVVDRKVSFLKLRRFIIPKPDPLVEIFDECFNQDVLEGETWSEAMARKTKAAMEARGLKIVEKNDD